MVTKRQKIMDRLKPLLEAVSDLDWYISKDKNLGAYGAIRVISFVKDAKDLGPFTFCPLTRVSLEKKNYLPIGKYIEAGESLGFDLEEAHLIACAADDRCITEDERYIRAQMILILKPKNLPESA